MKRLFLLLVSAWICSNLSADNTIWYQTTDGEVLYPASTSAIDGMLTDNVYADGCGTMVFAPQNGTHITTIGEKAFAELGINTYFDPKNDDEIRTIGKNPFSADDELGYHRLQSIVLDEGITTIGTRAFADCASLTDVELPASLTTIHSAAFANDTALLSIGRPFPKQQVEDHTFANCWSLNDIDLSNVVGKIGRHAFSLCRSMTDISIPEGVESIGDSAFFYCGATSLHLPSNLESIGRGAFQGMPITSVEIPNTIHTLPYFAFAFTHLKHVSIPSSVTVMESSCFECCYELESIDIPSTVTSFGHAVFANCPSFRYINYDGTIEQWNSIKKDDRWYKGTWHYTPLMVVHCTDGDIDIEPHYEAEVNRGNYILQMTDAGWSTLCIPFRFFVPQGLTAYSVTGVNESTGELKLKKLTASINNSRGNYPYLVNGKPGYYLFTGKINSADSNLKPENGLLIGSADSPIPVPADDNYVLQKQNDYLAFYRVTDNTSITLPPNRAYLHYAGSVEKAGVLYIESVDYTRLDNTPDTSEPCQIWSIDGLPRSTYRSGINIVGSPNGSRIKIILQ